MRGLRQPRRRRTFFTLLALTAGIYLLSAIFPRRRRRSSTSSGESTSPVPSERATAPASEPQEILPLALDPEPPTSDRPRVVAAVRLEPEPDPAQERIVATARGLGSMRAFTGRPAPELPPIGVLAGAVSLPRIRRPRRQGALGFVTMLAAFALFFIPGALGDHGSAYVNLTVADADVEHNGALFVQGGVGAGTGNFDPFLTLSQQGSADVQKGYNTTAASGEFDTFFGGDRTHPISAAAIPSIDIGGTLYREFTLDANDSGSDDFMSIDSLSIYLDNENDLTDYDHANREFGSDTGSTAFLIYDLEGAIGGDAATVLMRSQSLTPGSGVSDITVLLPDDEFPAECFYGSTTCGLWLYFYTDNGNLQDATAAAACAPSCNWNVTAGFEEWQTRLQPVVNVQKDATPAFDRTFDWTVKKYVTTDESCPEPSLTGYEDDTLELDLFDGQSDTVCWRIDSDRGDPVDSGHSVSGTITITNPTGAEPIQEDIDAVINSVDDVVTQGLVDTTADVDCGVDFPFTLDPGEVLVCSYSADLPSGADGTNTATVNIVLDEDEETTGDYEGTADVDFSLAVPNITDDTATLDDIRDTAGLPKGLTGDDTHTYTEVFTCDDDEGLSSNTATLTEDDSGTEHTDDAAVDLTCHELTVTKNATATFNRSFDWTVKKYVTADESCPEPSLTGYEDGTLNLDLFAGQSDTVCWRIDSDRGDPVDSGFNVQGTITIQNPAPIAANGVAVSDELAGGIAATVDCDGVPGAPFTTTVNVPASSSAQCTYTASPPDATDRLNTATATLAGVDYTGTALADFGDPTAVTDETATLDDIRDAAGLPKALTGDDTHTYTEVFTCNADEGLNSNTATLTEDDSLTQHTDDAAVDLDCHGLTVTKDADETYTRTFDWTVKKYVSADETCAGGFVDDTLNVTLTVGESEVVCWKIDVDRLAPVDSDFAVSGTITIQNDAPIPAEDVAVSDVITPGPINATVDCDDAAGNQTTVDVPAESSAECEYSASLPNADQRLNTATATLAGVGYGGTADVIFGDPTTVIDETATLDDDRKPSGFPQQFSGDGSVTYTEELECGQSRTESNLATLTEDDTSQTRTDPAAVNLTCEEVFEGCTPGYWKTHPGSWGPTGYATTDTLESVFDVPDSLGLDDVTLLQALDFGGGGGVQGAAQILLRAAVAALLNSAHPGVDYPRTTAEVIADVNAALASGNRGTMLSLARALDEDNNLGCPLS